MPEPSSDSSPTFVSSVTTLGSTLAATCSTEGGAEKLTAERGVARTGDKQLPADGGRTHEYSHRNADRRKKHRRRDATHNRMSQHEPASAAAQSPISPDETGRGPMAASLLNIRHRHHAVADIVVGSGAADAVRRAACAVVVGHGEAAKPRFRSGCS